MNDPDTVQIFGDTVMCDSSGGVLFADLGYTQFQWSTGSRDPSISYTSPGVYSVTVQDAGFCVTSDTIDVVQKPSINPVIGGNSHYCFQDSTVLSVGVFNTYLWSNGAVSPSLKARAGNYSVTVSNSDGCIGTDQNFRVTQSSPEANIFIEEEVCADEVLTLYTRVGDQESILWGTGEVSDTIYSIPSRISLRIIDRDNCQADSVKEFLALPSPEAGIEMSPISYSEAYLPVNFNDASDLNGANIVSWFWQVNDSIIGNSEDTSITFYEGALLDVIHALVSDEGCTDTIRINYRITDDIVKVNIITPNGDGVNDFLVFPNIQKYPNNELFIYNRWGVEIAHYSGYYNHWDGYGLPEGTYFYVLELEEGVHPVKGSFTLLR
jgi:gliding motility-associated-like protein